MNNAHLKKKKKKKGNRDQDPVWAYSSLVWVNSIHTQWE